jgi:hypothetical protein
MHVYFLCFVFKVYETCMIFMLPAKTSRRGRNTPSQDFSGTTPPPWWKPQSKSMLDIRSLKTTTLSTTRMTLKWKPMKR